MEVLILGCGKLSNYLIPMLVSEGLHVALVDKHEECLVSFAHQRTVEVNQATGVLMEDLRRANIDRTDIFLALSEDDHQNAMAAQIASYIFNVPQVICQIGDVDRSNAYQKIGLTVVCPTTLAAKTIRQALRVHD